MPAPVYVTHVCDEMLEAEWYFLLTVSAVERLGWHYQGFESSPGYVGSSKPAKAVA